MVFLYKHAGVVTTRIEVNYPTNTVKIKNYTDNPLFRAFGVNENPTVDDFENFLEDRCFPRNRDKMKMHLRELGIQSYDPYQIVLKTSGRLHGDDMSLELEEEDDYEELQQL